MCASTTQGRSPWGPRADGATMRLQLKALIVAGLVVVPGWGCGRSPLTPTPAQALVIEGNTGGGCVAATDFYSFWDMRATDGRAHLFEVTAHRSPDAGCAPTTAYPLRLVPFYRSTPSAATFRLDAGVTCGHVQFVLRVDGIVRATTLVDWGVTCSF
jgi:hypothetical protein